MSRDIRSLGNIISFTSSIISIAGAIITIVKSRSARKSLDEIIIKESAVEVNNFKEGLNKLYTDINNHLRTREINIGMDSETRMNQKWLNMISDLIIKLPDEFNDMEEKLKEIRFILKDHIYNNNSLHDKIVENETMFTYIEGVIYGLNLVANKKS